jgi:hypothetical protein
MSIYLYLPFILTPRMRWVGHMACMGDRRVALRVLLGRPQQKKTSCKIKHRWEDDVKMDLQ